MTRDPSRWGPISSKEPTNAYQAIESLCTQLDPKHNTERLYNEGQQFASASEAVDKEMESFKLAIAKVSLVSLVLLWSQYMSKDRMLGQRNLNMMKELMIYEALPLHSDHQLITIHDLADFNHENMIDAIRCHPDWPIQMKEDFVSFYIEFANWLSSSTYGLISSAVDPDRKFTARRQLSYDEFVKLITYLPQREKILAKLFYLGGERTLEEVISLKIEDIDFKTGRIHFEKHFVRYPKHVLIDIKGHIGSKKKGFVFANKTGERLNHTVPYRALKNAVQKLNLPSSFTFKDLIREF